jgi:hopene-associated glycosyltransferase HpnB
VQAEFNYLIFGIVCVSPIIWLFLLIFWGDFWKTDQQLLMQREQGVPFVRQGDKETRRQGEGKLPSVCAIVPARNEAELLPTTLRSLLHQDYPGYLSVIVVDDRSTDRTAEVALQTAESILPTQQHRQFKLLTAEPLPSGWTGKLWAIEQGICYAKQEIAEIDYFLLTDADIEHNSHNLTQLIAKAQADRLDLVSLMVLLRCQSFWENMLIPAFVFFFAKLYPFAWVNNPDRLTAAAAGGCILLRQEALNRLGGMKSISKALIDDCALGQAVKADRGRIWLGLTSTTKSLRAYPSLASIWDMVARTAYTQLQYSPWLLFGTIVAMTLVYLVSPLGLGWGILTGDRTIAIAGLLGWLLMSFAYLPTILFYQRSPLLSCCLPFIALLYTLMTLDSALRHYQGRGGVWKGRVNQQRLIL